MEPHGCNRWQISCKSAGPRNRKNKRNPLPPAATGCLGKYPAREGVDLLLKGQILQTRRPAGLDRETLTRTSFTVKQVDRLAAWHAS